VDVPQVVRRSLAREVNVLLSFDVVHVASLGAVDHKRLLIIDVGLKSLVYFDWYADPAIEGGALRYNRVLKASKGTKKEIPCPDAEKWEKEGLAVLYVEKMTLDLGTMKETHSGDFFCKQAAPITKRAPDYTIH